MAIGQRIVKMRKERGWTQARLAELSALSASAIAMYETERRMPDETSLGKLAAAFEISPAALTGDSNIATVTESQHSAAAAAQANGESPNQSRRSEMIDGTTQLSLSRDEARIILFLRMNPQAMPFIQSYITAGNQRRNQLEKTWRLINEFQN